MFNYTQELRALMRVAEDPAWLQAPSGPIRGRQEKALTLFRIMMR